MINRRLQSCFFILTAIIAPAAGLGASEPTPINTELRAAVLQADQVEQSPDVQLETELTNWLKVKDQPVSLDREPTRPQPRDVPEQKREHTLAALLNQTSGGAHHRARSREIAIIQNRNTATEGPRESEAHVPSAYLKYLSLRYHAGPPAKANR